MRKYFILFITILFVVSCNHANENYSKSATLTEIDISKFTNIVSKLNTGTQNWLLSIYKGFQNPEFTKMSIDIDEVDTLNIILDNTNKDNNSCILFINKKNGFGLNVSIMKQSSIDLRFDSDDNYFDYDYIYRLTKKEDRILFSWIKDSVEVKKPHKTPTVFSPNQKFPFFKTKTINDEIFNLENIKDEIIVINWWHTGCTPCREEIPELNKVYDKYNKDIKFIAISDDKNIEYLKEFLSKTEFKYQHLISNEYIKNIFPSCYPCHVIIDKNGKVIFAKTSNRTFEEFDEILKSL